MQWFVLLTTRTIERHSIADSVTCNIAVERVKTGVVSPLSNLVISSVIEKFYLNDGRSAPLHMTRSVEGYRTLSNVKAQICHRSRRISRHRILWNNQSVAWSNTPEPSIILGRRLPPVSGSPSPNAPRLAEAELAKNRFSRVQRFPINFSIQKHRNYMYHF